jgi:hypothetical protein
MTDFKEVDKLMLELVCAGLSDWETGAINLAKHGLIEPSSVGIGKRMGRTSWDADGAPTQISSGLWWALTDRGQRTDAAQCESIMMLHSDDLSAAEFCADEASRDAQQSIAQLEQLLASGAHEGDYRLLDSSAMRVRKSFSTG